MLIAIFVLFTGVKVIIRCIKGLLENRSKLPDVAAIEQSIASIEHVQNVHNVTVMRQDKDIVVGAHVVLKQHCTVEKHDEACRLKVEQLLLSRFKVNKSVLQIESHECHYVN